MLCQDCSKKPTCVELCEKAERHVNRKYISQRETTFPTISIENLNLTLDNLSYYKSIHTFPELSSYFNEPGVNFPFLSELQNKCLHLFYFHGLTYKQIAYRLSNQYQQCLSHQIRYRIYKAKRTIFKQIFYIEGTIKDDDV